MLRHEGKVVCVIDVASDGAGACLMRAGKGVPHILFSKRALLSVETRTDEQARSGVMQLLETILKEMPHEHVPESVRVVVHAPWSRFHTASGNKTYPEEKVITKTLIDEAAREALQGIAEKDAEAGVMRIFLNGYPTGNPIGKRARELDAVVFGGTIEPGVRSGVEHVIGTYFPGRTPIFHTGARTLLSLVHERVPDMQRLVILSLRGATECMVVRHESETQYAKAPEGLATILQRIAPQGLPEETLSLITMAESDSCSTEACATIKDAVARIEPELVRAFGAMLTELANVRRVPNDMVLFAPKELAPWLSQLFTRIDFSQFTATTQPFRVTAITAADLENLVLLEKGVKADTPLAVASATVHMFETA